MKIIEVKEKKEIKDFLDFPKTLYKKDANWTCLLDAEVEGIFDKESNTCFEFGEAARWILKDNNNLVIGRIAAFYDKRKMNQSKTTSGGAGFFESIYNQEAANLLFDTAKNWLESKGMKAMDAPITFGENLFNWGLLVEGFMPQGIGMPYNFYYYKKLFEEYGFKNYFEQYSYHKNLAEPWPERMLKFASFLISRPDYEFEHFNFKEKEKYIKIIVELYNSVWSEYHDDYTPLKYEEIERMFNDAKSIIDPELIWFAFHNNKPIGMVIGYPDIYQVFRKLKNGKLNLINKLKFLKHKKNITRARIIASGVIKEYRTKGIIACLFHKLIEALNEKNHTELELSWTGDYNHTVLNIYNQIGAYKAKTHITYRYMFDKEAEFKRFTNEHEDKIVK